MLSDQELIEIKKKCRAEDPTKPWGDTIAFGQAVQKELLKKQTFIEALSCLEDALNGLKWYFDMYPNTVSEADEEMMKRIDKICEELFEEMK